MADPKPNKKRKTTPEKAKKRKTRKTESAVLKCDDCGKEVGVRCECGKTFFFKDAETCRCNRVTCDKCARQHDSSLPLGEWLSASQWCDTCGRLVCHGCVWTCYSCASENDMGDVGEPPTYCVNCKPDTWTEVTCEYHTWQRCGKHKGEPCGTCGANRNYERYGV